MKKTIIAVIVVIILAIGYISLNLNKNIDNILAKYEAYESDGYYDNKNNVEAAGYIVSRKTEEGYRYGYINYKGKLLLDVEYNSIYRIPDIENKNKIYLIAVKNGRYGVSLNGKTIINYEYQFIDYYDKIEGFVLQKMENYGVADIKGKIIIPVKNESVEVKSEYIYVTNEESNKVYDKNGNEVQIDFNTFINKTENDNYFIKIVEKDESYLYGVLGKNGKELIKSNYTYIEYLFDDYFIAADSNNKEGIIDISNNIKLQFDYALVQKIQDSNLIRTIKGNVTEIYSKNFEKICTMSNANIETEGSTIKVYNDNEVKYFDKN